MLQLNNAHPQPTENNTFSHLRKMEAIKPLLAELTTTELPFESLANQAMICLDKIGNVRRARYAVAVDVYDGFAELPANCEQIEAVLTAGPRALSDAWLPGPSVAPDQIGGAFRLDDGVSVLFSAAGAERYTDFTFRDGGLYVGRQSSYRELVQGATGLGRHSSVLDTAVPDATAPLALHVFYRGEVTDERGYRLITNEEALACAYFSNSVVTYRRYQEKQVGRQDWLDAVALSDKHINQARTAPLASGNALDQALDAGKSYHRHFITDDLRLQ